MITFYFKSNKGPYCEVDEEKAKDYFLNAIGELRNEFDQSDVFVEVNMDVPGSNNKYLFYSTKVDVGVLVWKQQQYRRVNPH